MRHSRGNDAPLPGSGTYRPRSRQLRPRAGTVGVGCHAGRSDQLTVSQLPLGHRTWPSGADASDYTRPASLRPSAPCVLHKQRHQHAILLWQGFPDCSRSGRGGQRRLQVRNRRDLLQRWKWLMSVKSISPGGEPINWADRASWMIFAIPSRRPFGHAKASEQRLIDSTKPCAEGHSVIVSQHALNVGAAPIGSISRRHTRTRPDLPSARTSGRTSPPRPSRWLPADRLLVVP